MKKGWRPWVLVILGLASSGLNSSCARARVANEGSVVAAPRVRWRDRNPYFVARPTYPPAPQGARANITFEPYTRWYYPNEGSYYPPIDEFPSIRSR